MIAGIFILVAFTIAIGISILFWRDMKSEARQSTVKTVGFTMVCCLLAMVVLSFIVILF
jgi:hypothetical protein